MKIAMANDHAGTRMKNEIKAKNETFGLISETHSEERLSNRAITVRLTFIAPFGQNS